MALDHRPDDERTNRLKEMAVHILEGGGCPFCEEYDGDHPTRHAVKAHPEEWADYTEE